MNKAINNNGYEYVDLGLPSGTLWAACNVGAKKPSDYGLYFQWGDTQGYVAKQLEKDKQFNWDDYKFSINGSGTNFSKYTAKGATLNLEDDAANASMGGDWHIPTPAQIQELIDNTTSEWTELDDIKGRMFTSTRDKTNSIFIPAAGIAWDCSVGINRSFGAIWSSMLNAYYDYLCQHLLISLGGASLGNSGCRCAGRSIRGVIG